MNLKKPSVFEKTSSLTAAENVGPDLGGLLHILAEKRKRGETPALAVILACHGSTPRKPGTAMLVGADGSVAGTLGGGALEAQVVTAARQAVREGRSRCWTFSLTSRAAAEEGMICGGKLEVLVDCLDDPGASRGEILERALRCREEGRDGWLVYSLHAGDTFMESGRPASPQKWEREHKGGAEGKKKAPGGEAVRIGLGFVSGDEFITGTLDTCGADPGELAAAIRKECRGGPTLMPMGAQKRYFLLPLTTPIMVVITGAGHIARALCPLCRFAGFRTTIIDDRDEFARPELFPEAGRVMVKSAYENCFGELGKNETHYIVIATRGHLSDAAVLAQALRTDAAYIGMIGSRRKRETIYRHLAGEGFSPEVLARVHCPIGLAIGAQTPEEIAVSIIAELIAVRSAG